MLKTNLKLTYWALLKMQREKKGIEQQKLAKKLKISAQMLSHLETGKREAKLSFIKKWAKLLNLNFDISLVKGA